MHATMHGHDRQCALPGEVHYIFTPNGSFYCAYCLWRFYRSSGYASLGMLYMYKINTLGIATWTASIPHYTGLFLLHTLRQDWKLPHIYIPIC